MRLVKFIEGQNSYLYNYRASQDIYYHGTRSVIPFTNFNETMIGSGLVSIASNQYDGFFFTSEKDNAEYYTEYFLCTVKIDKVVPAPKDKKHPSSLLKIGLENRQNYRIYNILDGSMVSDIVVVPKNNLDTIHIVEWEFIGDEEALFEQYDNFFGGNFKDIDDDDNYDDDGNFIEQAVTTDMIDETLEMIEIDVNYLLKIPIFKKYYLSK